MTIRCSRQSETRYYNYKGFFSVVMLALVNTDYGFLFADVGSNVSCSDTQIFNKCQLKQNIIDETIGFPDADPLPGNAHTMLHCGG